MSALHFHLALNHIPILGPIFGFSLLLYGILYKNNTLYKAGLLFFVITAIFTIPVFLTGSGAEEQVERFPGVLHSIIQDHEEIAEAALWMMEILGILSLMALSPISQNLSRQIVQLVIAILAITTIVTMVSAGYVGGMIQHTEIYSKAKISKYLELE